jgi:hypothetical protein
LSKDYLKSYCDLGYDNYIKLKIFYNLNNDFYKYSTEESITLTRPNNQYYYGLFSDRSSASKFVNFIQTTIDGKVKDKIMDILSIVGGETEDLERILKSFSKIRVHGLYDNELRPNNSGLSKKWFNKIIT